LTGLRWAVHVGSWDRGNRFELCLGYVGLP
jgi:hypothetical protein